MATSVTTQGPAVRFKDPQIEMAHGAGGKASRRLIPFLLLCYAVNFLDRVNPDRHRCRRLGSR